MVRKPSYQELYDLAIFAQILQPHALSVIKKEGFVFDGSGGKWERLAFSFYADLCELESKARSLFKEEDKPRQR